MIIAEDNLIQKISFMSEGKIQVALLFLQLTKISIIHEYKSLLTFLFVSLDGKCRIAYCTSLESIETRKFRMRINQTEYRVGLPKETQFTSTDVSNSATGTIALYLAPHEFQKKIL